MDREALVLFSAQAAPTIGAAVTAPSCVYGASFCVFLALAVCWYGLRRRYVP